MTPEELPAGPVPEGDALDAQRYRKAVAHGVIVLHNGAKACVGKDEADAALDAIAPSPAVAQPVTDERCVALDDVINVLTKRIQSRYQDHQRTDGETGERYFDTDQAEQMEAAYHAELGALSEVMTLKNAARAALCQSSTVQPVAVAMNVAQGGI